MKTVWEVLVAGRVLVPVGAALLLVVAVFHPRGSADPDASVEEEDDGRDEGAEWDRAHDRWVDEQNGVA